MKLFCAILAFSLLPTTYNRLNRKLGSCDGPLVRIPAHKPGQDIGAHAHIPWWESRKPLPPLFTSRRKTVVRSAVIFCNAIVLCKAFLKTSIPCLLRSGHQAQVKWRLGDQYRTFRMGSVAGVAAIQNFSRLGIPVDPSFRSCNKN